MNLFQLGQMGQPADGLAWPCVFGLAVAAVAVALLLADRARLLRQLKVENAARREAEARTHEAAAAVPGRAAVAAVPPPVELPPAAEPGLLDLARIDELRALGVRTGRDLLSSLAGLFRESSAQQLAELRLAFEVEDPQAVQRAAHTLKSSAGNIGATEAAELARQIEEAGRAGSILAARPLFDRLAAQIPRVAGELERLAGRSG